MRQQLPLQEKKENYNLAYGLFVPYANIMKILLIINVFSVSKNFLVN